MKELKLLREAAEDELSMARASRFLKEQGFDRSRNAVAFAAKRYGIKFNGELGAWGNKNRAQKKQSDEERRRKQREKMKRWRKKRPLTRLQKDAKNTYQRNLRKKKAKALLLQGLPSLDEFVMKGSKRF